MKRWPLLGRGKSASAPEESVGAEESDDMPPIASAGQVVTDGFSKKLIHGLLLLCLAMAPVGALLGWMAWTRPAPAAAAKQQQTQNGANRDVAGMFAAEVVTVWLTSSRSTPDQATAVLPGLQVTDLPTTPFKVKEVTVGQVLDVGQDRYTVTIGATVTDITKATVRRHFQLPVQVSGGTVTALGLPSVVAAPRVTAPTTSIYEKRVEVGSAPGQAAGQFLTSLLTGQGDVSRYVPPGVQIDPITPAPFVAVRVDEVLAAAEVPAEPVEGARLQLQVNVTGTVTVRQQISSTYWLTLAARGGRWEIASIDPQPAAAPTSSRRSPTPGHTR